MIAVYMDRAVGKPVKSSKLLKKRRCESTSHLPHVALAICFIVPLAGAAWLVESFGVNVFWLDGWRMTDLITGPFSMKELFEPYNEHTYVLPRLAAMVTGWDSVSQMYVVVASLGVAAFFTVLSMRLSGGHLLWATPAPALLLGFRHQENLLWGNQTSFALALCLAIVALFVMGTRWWYAGVLLALGATLSAAQGVLAWPAGVVVLLLRRRWVAAGAWVVIGAGVWIWYLGRYQGAASTGYALTHPLEALTYLAALSGGSFGGGGAVWVGAVVLSLAPFALWLARRSASLAGIIFYALLCLASITIGRVETGIFEGCCPATASRYAIFSSLLLAGVYGALAVNAHRKLPGALAALLLVGMLFGITISYQEGLRQAQRSYENRDLYREAVRENYDPPALSAVYAENEDPTAVIKRAGVNAFEFP